MIWRGLFVVQFAMLSACAAHPDRQTWERPDLALRAVKLISDHAVPAPALQPMTLGALYGLEHALPPDRFKVGATADSLLIDYTTKDEPPGEAIFPAPTSLNSVMNTLSRAYAIAHDAAPEADPEASQVGMIKEALQAIDPPGFFFDAQEYRAMTIGTAGVGLMVRRRGEDVVISDTISGSPAAQAGLQPGERLVAIDDTSVQGMELSKVTGRLRGPPETSVNITVEGRDGRRRTVPIARALVIPRAVVQSLGDGIAYVQLRLFNGASEAQVAAALRIAGKGLLLDLRHNEGGPIDSVVAVAGMLLDPGKLVARLEGRPGRSPEDLETRNVTGIYRRPIVVLVDRETESGAEMLAAALRADGGAKLVGTTTFGDDLIRTIIPLPDGSAISLPTEHWLTPNGLQLAGKGLPPDVLVEATNSPDHWLLTHDVDIHERMMYDEVFETGLQELRRLGGPELKAELTHPTKGALDATRSDRHPAVIAEEG
jgi:carboxyl-terminal processing protease